MGGVGEVRAGHDRRLHRDVAIKLLRPEMALQSGVRKRFEHEAKMAARLSHPNIVAVFDFGVEQGVPFLVMERLPGQTLGDVLADGPLGFGETEELGRQLVDALASAHRSGMLHRDIKPRNVLVAGPGIWKLGDFGIAKSIEAGDDPGLTATGLVVGTPAYLPPERLAGRPATVASDIYGVGVVLYQAVSGQSPFQPGVPLPALASSDPCPLREGRPDIAPALDAVIARAMARDPSARFASAAEMAAALRAASAERASTASADSASATATAVAAATATAVASAPPPPPLTDVLVPRGDRRAPTGWVGRRVVTAAAVAALVLLVSLLVLVAGGNRNAPASQITVPSTTAVGPAAPTTIASTSAPTPATVASATAGRAPAPAHTDKGKKKK